MALERRSTMLAALLISAGLLQTVLAADYVVGGATTGWNFAASDFYNDWAAAQDLRVGDNLIFNWEGQHDAVQLSPADTEACNLSGNEINKWTVSGVSVPLNDVGTFGYICSIGNHCSNGFMKMTVNVKEADSSASPPPPATTTPAPPTATSPPPPSSRSSTSSLMQLCQPLTLALLAVFAISAALFVY